MLERAHESRRNPALRVAGYATGVALGLLILAALYVQDLWLPWLERTIGPGAFIALLAVVLLAMIGYSGWWIASVVARGVASLFKR